MSTHSRSTLRMPCEVSGMVPIKSALKLLTRWAYPYQTLVTCWIIVERSITMITNRSNAWLRLSSTQSNSYSKQLKVSSSMESTSSKMCEKVCTTTEWATSLTQENTLDRLQPCFSTGRLRWLSIRSSSSISTITGKNCLTRLTTRKMTRCTNSKQ